jgi:hypothetical protein
MTPFLEPFDRTILLVLFSKCKSNFTNFGTIAQIWQLIDGKEVQPEEDFLALTLQVEVRS